MLSGVIKPSIKDKSGNIKCSNNYREVMISTNFFKIVEYMMLPFIKKINLSPYQFAYRSDSSTILANAILREILNSDIVSDCTIYSCLLDLSKAFERVDHAKLLTKLQENHLPPFILNMIKFILFNTRIYVNFNGSFSPEWNIVRVRQGGVTSAFLFNIYINEIIEHLSHLNLGCKLEINMVNIMAYADDIILLSPSVKSLQFLIDKISELFNDHLLTINVNKTVVIVF